MANYVYSRLLIEGDHDALETMLNDVRTPESPFDFETFCPLPPDIKAVDHMPQTACIETYLRTVNPRNPMTSHPDFPKLPADKFDAILDDMCNCASIRRNVVETDDPQNPPNPLWLAPGEQFIKNRKTYGFVGSYEWCVFNWGCAGTAADVDITFIRDDALFVGFQTCWTAPMEAICAFAAKYPDFKIKFEYAEECAATQAGYGLFESGRLKDAKEYPDGSRASYEMYFSIWGIIPEECDYYFDPMIDNYVYMYGGNPFLLGSVPRTAECALILNNNKAGKPSLFMKIFDGDPDNERSWKLWAMRRRPNTEI